MLAGIGCSLVPVCNIRHFVKTFGAAAITRSNCVDRNCTSDTQREQILQQHTVYDCTENRIRGARDKSVGLYEGSSKCFRVFGISSTFHCPPLHPWFWWVHSLWHSLQPGLADRIGRVWRPHCDGGTEHTTNESIQDACVQVQLLRQSHLICWARYQLTSETRGWCSDLKTFHFGELVCSLSQLANFVNVWYCGQFDRFRCCLRNRSQCTSDDEISLIV